MCSRWWKRSAGNDRSSKARRKSWSLHAGAPEVDLDSGIWVWKDSEIRAHLILLRLQLEAGRGEAIEAPPQQAVDEHHDGGHDERRSEQDVEAAGVAGAGDVDGES